MSGRIQRRSVVLLSAAVVMALALSAAPAFAGSSYAADTYDFSDGSKTSARDITSQVRATGAGLAPYTEAHTFYAASDTSSAHDEDWFRFDVSSQEVVWGYTYLIEAVSTYSKVDPVIEVYTAADTPNDPVTFAPGAADPSAVAFDYWGVWFSWSHPTFGSQSTQSGASLIFRPWTAGTYYIRVRPYADNTGSFYRAWAGPYQFRMKVGASTRVSGDDRYKTAVAISKERHLDEQLDGMNGWANQASCIVANGTRFPDALSGSSLAGVCQGPILLAKQDALPAASAAELVRLDPDVVYMLGSEDALSNQVKQQIEALFPASDPVFVVRLGGHDRIDTCVEIADEMFAQALSTPVTPPGFAFIADAYNFPDALSASSMAAGSGVPVLLTRGNSLDSRVAKVINDYSITDVVIVGGPAAISNTVESQLKTMLGSTRVLRLGGSDRYETSKVFASWAAGLPAGSSSVGTPGNPHAIQAADPCSFGVATGQDFPDALAAGPFCGGDWYGQPKPLLITPKAEMSKWLVDIYGRLGPGQTDYISDMVAGVGSPGIYRCYIFGGEPALSSDVWWALDTQS